MKVDPVTLRQEEWLTRFDDYLRYERRYSVHTVESYLKDTGQFLAYLHAQYNECEPSNVSHHQIRSWIVSLMKAKLSTSSVRRKVSSISHFYKWQRKNGFIDHDPVVKVQLPKMPERLPGSISEKSLQKLWRDVLGSDGTDSFDLLRNKVMIGLLYGCGLRRSELIRMKWSDFDKSREVLRVFGKGRKYRQVPVSKEVTKWLERLRSSAENEWGAEIPETIMTLDNGKPCYPKFVHNKVAGMLAAVTTSGKRSPHILRHSMATHMMDKGAELNAIKSILGHSSLASTQVYTHNSISRLKEVYRLAHPGAQQDNQGQGSRIRHNSTTQTKQNHED